MSEKKFTSGPWKVADESVVTADYTRCICTMESDGGYEVPNEELEANAALIAASPELFEALKIARGVIIEHHNYSLMRQELNACPFCSSVEGDAKLNKIYAALAKAAKLSN